MVGGEADELKSIVGYITTIPSQAQHEDVDIRATHFRRYNELCTHPSLPLTASVVGITQSLKHQYTTPYINDNTATQTTLPPNVQLGFSPHVPPYHIKQNTCMFWLSGSDTRCQSLAKRLCPNVNAPIPTPWLFAIMHEATCENLFNVYFRSTPSEHT